MESLLEYIRENIIDVPTAKRLKNLAKEVNRSMLDHEFHEELIMWNKANPYEKVRILEEFLRLRSREPQASPDTSIYCKNAYYRKLVHNVAEVLGYYTQREGHYNTRMPGDYTPGCSVCEGRYYGAKPGTPEFYRKTYRIDTVRISKIPIKNTWKEHQHKKIVRKRRQEEKLARDELKRRLHEELIAYYYEPGHGGYHDSADHFKKLLG